MQAQLGRLILSLLAIAVPTVIAQYLYPHIGEAGAIMLFLLAVVLASYYLPYYAAISVAIISFFVINYLVMEPRHTFAVSKADSLAALLGFIAMSVVITTLVRRLRERSQQATEAHARAETARLLAVQLTQLDTPEGLFSETCRCIWQATKMATSIYTVDMTDAARSPCKPVAGYHLGDVQAIDCRAVRWCCQSGVSMGPGTDNWPDLPTLLIPLTRAVKGMGAVLVIVPGKVMEKEEAEQLFQFMRGLANQVSMAYQRLLSLERERVVMRSADEESVRNALLSSIAHDMRTPLTRILGTATVLQGNSAMSEAERGRLLRQLVDEARHMANASETVLCLARIESLGESGVQLDWQSAEEIMGAVAERHVGEARLHLQVESDLPLFRGDAVLLTQAILNLVDNAFKHGAPDQAVTLAARAQDGQLSFSVVNAGPGVPPHVLANLGKKFIKGDPAAAQGYGLGLAIVEAVARVHGGKFVLSNRAEGGVCATLLLPYGDVENEA